jgi:hypothetical protein
MHEMSRYFFHVEDGKRYRDHVGVELPNLKAVRAEALRATGEMLRDNGLAVWDGEEWEMQVVDEAGLPIFTLTFSAASHRADTAPIAA